MPQKQHVYKLVSSISPEDVFRILKRVCEHENQTEFEPEFEFDWIGRKIVISATSGEGLTRCREHFLRLLQKEGADADGMLPGKVVTQDDRYSQPFGILLQDAATFGELIGRSLVDIGLRGIQVVDSSDACKISIRLVGAAKTIDYSEFLQEFPLPTYIKLIDEGIHEVEDARKPSSKSLKKKRKKR